MVDYGELITRSVIRIKVYVSGKFYFSGKSCADGSIKSFAFFFVFVRIQFFKSPDIKGIAFGKHFFFSVISDFKADFFGFWRNF